MTAMWSMLGVALVAGVAMAGSPRKCSKVSLSQCNAANDGCWWWEDIIAKRCVYSNTGAGGKTKRVIEAFRCKTPGKDAKELKVNGPAIRDGHFGYECEKEGDALHVRPVECYASDNKRLTAGQSHDVGSWTYACDEDEDKQKNPIVKMEKFKKTFKCSYKGKEYKSGHTVKVDSVTFLRCVVKSGKAQLVLGGCYMKRSNGKTVGMNLFTEREGKYCQTGPKPNTAEVIEHGDKCEFDGKKYKIGEYFFARKMRLRCVHKINVSAYKKCLLTNQRAKCPRGTDIQTKGCQIEGTTKTLGIGAAVKLPSGKYQYCSGSHQSGVPSRVCVMKTITDANQQRCSDGRDINVYKTEDNVKTMCRWYKTGAKIISLHCVSDSGKGVGRNRILGDKKKGYAYRCEKDGSSLKWVKLSDEEYKKWAAGKSNVFTAGGGSGSGNAEENDNAPPTCKEGHKWSQEDKQCLDVNECATEEHDCLDDENCHNTKGGFVCKCKEGLTRMVLNNKCEMSECGCPSNVAQR